MSESDRRFMTDRTSPQYDATTIALHWSTAALVVVLWTIGQTADWFPRGPLRTNYWSAHVLLGLVLAVVLAWRILWRGLAGRRLPAADSGLLRLIAEATHYALYALLLIAVALGVVNAFLRGWNFFDVIHLPQFGDKAMRKPITDWHGLAANILLGLALLHAAAALMHHYAWKDEVLRRMAPRLQKRQPWRRESIRESESI
jgi:cytochrome b561